MSGLLSSIAGPVIGGLLGGSDSGSSQSTQQQIDPRIAQYIYGDDGTSGLIPAAYDWWSQNKSGLNDQMVQGLNRQYSVYSDPATAQGYTNIQQLGSNLLASPIAGNPFTDGRMTLPSQTGLLGSASAGTEKVAAQPALQFQSPATPTAGAAPFTAVAAPVAPAQTGQKADLSWMNPKLKNLANALTGGGLLNGAATPQPFQYANNN